MSCPTTITYVISAGTQAEYDNLVAHFNEIGVDSRADSRTDDATEKTVTLVFNATYHEDDKRLERSDA